MGAVPTNLWRLEIEIGPREVETLRGYYWNGRGEVTVERPEVAATIREGGNTFSNVAVHLKGSAGSFRPFDDKPALTLNFSKQAKGQRFHGLSKISLNNSVQDGSYLSEAICRELFLDAGIPVPRVHHATVVLNGRDLGMYVVAEGWDKTFLRRHFKDPNGNLYDGGFVQDIDGNLRVVSGDQPENRKRLDDLILAAQGGTAPEAWQRLDAVLDIDRFLTVFALDVIICNWDGYSINRNNYRIFHDRTSDRLIFMPHGIDQTFGSRRMGPQSPIRPPIRGQVAYAVLSQTEGRRRYYAHLANLMTNVFVEEKVVARVRELSAGIRPTLAAYGRDVAEEHDAEVSDLLRRIGERRRSLEAQLNPNRLALRFDTNRVARVTEWKPPHSDWGGIRFRYERRQIDGRSALVIIPSPQGGSGAWRARVSLDPGAYRFEGRARTRGAESDGGISFRSTGSPPRTQRVEGEAWVAFSAPFLVDEDQSELDLIVEFSGGTGEAQIDEASLQLVRE